MDALFTRELKLYTLPPIGETAPLFVHVPPPIFKLPFKVIDEAPEATVKPLLLTKVPEFTFIEPPELIVSKPKEVAVPKFKVTRLPPLPTVIVPALVAKVPASTPLAPSIEIFPVVEKDPEMVEFRSVASAAEAVAPGSTLNVPLFCVSEFVTVKESD
jgi:hypothetical protein